MSSQPYRGRRAPMSEVSAALALDIISLAHELFPAGRREGHEWVIGGLDGEPGQSLRICLAGSRKGLWYEHAEQRGGDPIELIAAARFAGDRIAAWHWAADHWLGLAQQPRPDPSRRQALPAHDDPDEARNRERKSAGAFGLWLAAKPAIRGTPVERYLTGTRGIPIGQLGRQSGALRYHPELLAEGRWWPAMVAVIGGTLRGQPPAIGVHRTFLAVRGDGSVGKAPIPSPKRVLGQVRGGIIPLWRGRSGKPLAAAPEDDVLALTEGIEDGLTVAVARPEWRVVAAVSVGNMATIELPPQLRTVVICADNDAAGSPAARALEAAVARFQEQGRRVRVAVSPKGKDFNDATVEAA